LVGGYAGRRQVHAPRGVAMLIASYELELRVSPHSVEQTEYEAIAHLEVDLSPVLPYLNAVLARGVYLPDKPALSWRYEMHNIGFWPDRIAVDNLDSQDQAQEVVAYLVNLVNQTWAKRDQLEPDLSTHQRLQPLELYRLLPQTNCGLCGESTCFNFALKLVAAQTRLNRCRPLYEEPANEARRARLEFLLTTKWPAG